MATTGSPVRGSTGAAVMVPRRLESPAAPGVRRGERLTPAPVRHTRHRGRVLPWRSAITARSRGTLARHRSQRVTMRDRTSCAGSVTPGPERRTYMRHGWRVAGLGAALTAVSLTTGCGPVARDSAAASASSASAAASAAATAAPGTYGSPADPSLPNPTDVATDAPVPSPTADSAPVVITYSGWTNASVGVEVGAYVSGIAESGGSCTLTLTFGSRSASSRVAGEPDVSSTSCPNMAVAADELSAGTWSAVVSYE